MSNFLGDVVFAAGNYIKDGQEKTRWMKVGAAFKKDGKVSIKLEALPITEGEVWLRIFEKDSQAQAQQSASPTDGFEDQDIPF